jgi:hypothetical protein
VATVVWAEHLAPLKKTNPAVIVMDVVPGGTGRMSMTPVQPFVTVYGFDQASGGSACIQTLTGEAGGLSVLLALTPTLTSRGIGYHTAVHPQVE